jgi:hypothetical protein
MWLNIKTLHEIFKHQKDGHSIIYEGKCCLCGKSTRINITKTLSGYGFLGGVLIETHTKDLNMECENCFKDRVKNGG